MSKCAFVVKYRNASSLRPDENSITVENERSLGEKLAQALTVTKERLSRCDWKTIVGNENDLAPKHWYVHKD